MKKLISASIILIVWLNLVFLAYLNIKLKPVETVKEVIIEKPVNYYKGCGPAEIEEIKTECKQRQIKEVKL